MRNDFAKAFDPSNSTTGDWNGILFGVLYGVLIFVGFETAANLGEETSEPKRQIPRAVLFSIVAVGVFYLIGAYTQVAGFGFELQVFTDPAVSVAPLFALGAEYTSSGICPTARAGRASSTSWLWASGRRSHRPMGFSPWLGIGVCLLRSPQSRSTARRSEPSRS